MHLTEYQNKPWAYRVQLDQHIIKNSSHSLDLKTFNAYKSYVIAQTCLLVNILSISTIPLRLLLNTSM